MALPIIEKPTFTTTLPTGKQIRFRPFTVKEQKNLLIVAEGGDEKDILHGIVDLVNECTFGKIDWLAEPTANLEHAFLHIRGKSVGEVVELTYQCLSKDSDGHTCNHRNHMDVDVREAKHEPFPDTTIKVNDTVAIVLDHVTVKDVLDNMGKDDPVQLVFAKTKMVVDGETIITEFSLDEFRPFLDSFPPDASERLDAFFRNQPTLVLKPDTCCAKCNNKSSIELKGVLNFFG